MKPRWICLTWALVVSAGHLPPARADVGEAPLFDATVKEVSPFADRDDQGNAIARDIDGSTVVGGHFSADAPSCVPATHAFVRRFSGPTSWRRHESQHLASTCTEPTGCQLFARFTALDPAYIFASAVHAVAVDLDNGDIFATGEVLVAWQGGTCAAGVEAAKGTFLLHLTRDGLLIDDAYLGPQPAGPPAQALACAGGCLTASLAAQGEVVGRGLALLSDGDLVVTGRYRPAATPEVPAPSADLFVARFPRPLASPRWVVTSRSPADDEGLAVAVDTLTGTDVLVAGYRGAGRDVFVGRYAGLDGALLGFAQAGGPGADEASSLALDFEGNVFVAGFFSDSASFGPLALAHPGNGRQIFLARYSPALEPQWVRAAGGTGADAATGVAVGLSGLFLTGTVASPVATFEGTLEGNLPLVNPGGNDLFLAKYDSEGILHWATLAGGPQTGDRAEALGLAVAGVNDLTITGRLRGTVIFPGVYLVPSSGPPGGCPPLQTHTQQYPFPNALPNALPFLGQLPPLMGLGPPVHAAPVIPLPPESETHVAIQGVCVPKDTSTVEDGDEVDWVLRSKHATYDVFAAAMVDPETYTSQSGVDRGFDGEELVYRPGGPELE